MRPADHLVPAAIWQFITAFNVEGKRHAERACDDFPVGYTGECVVLPQYPHLQVYQRVERGASGVAAHRPDESDIGTHLAAVA